MPRMTKAQARKRLNEARQKVKTVYMADKGFDRPVFTTHDMAAIEKIIDKCLKRLN